MGNIPSPPSNYPPPPRYEESISRVVDRNRPRNNADCPCHRGNPAFKAAIEELAREAWKKECTHFLEWENGRIKSLLGIVRAPSFVCDVKDSGICRCHAEYTILEREITFQKSRLNELDAVYLKQRKESLRSEADMLSWARHKEDILYLHGMLRDCKGESDVVIAQQAQKQELKRKVEALAEKIEKLLLK